MIDACDASYNAVRLHFPNCTILITTFRKIKGLQDFKRYFENEWLSERWWRWQLFQVFPGYPTTNSCIESHNKLIKLLYTNYMCYSIHEMLRVVMDKLVYTILGNCSCKDADNDTISRSRDIDPSLFVINGNVEKNYLYDERYYLRSDINLIYHRHHYCSCTCKDFHRNFICKHALALAIKLKLKLKELYNKLDIFTLFVNSQTPKEYCKDKCTETNYHDLKDASTSSSFSFKVKFSCVPVYQTALSSKGIYKPLRQLIIFTLDRLLVDDDEDEDDELDRFWRVSSLDSKISSSSSIGFPSMSSSSELLFSSSPDPYTFNTLRA
ncbi:hypothetical protein BpHYR1_030843 [Brachionus plicatilis]|uniref:SWIM-type domain-containing protein n=1 Tax=Brachionus plicatilis TaxID=10195 RepID=A0A3M7Q280_BRAPC|nr:hypothetical protein BpHYR1_030843 [Brachionus plicatilis]